jgi:hypothetical protein
VSDVGPTLHTGEPPQPPPAASNKQSASAIAVSVAVGMVILGAADVFIAANHADTQTPCEAAQSLVAQVNDAVENDKDIPAHQSPDGSMPLWSELTRTADGIAAGSFTDVDGLASPELAAALYEFSRSSPFPGGARQALAHITAACR